MAKMTKTPGDMDPEALKQAIIDSEVWVVITIKENDQGAQVAVRESYPEASINTIAMLLEQKEIYDAVQAKIAQVKLKYDNKNNKNSPDLNVN